MRVFYATIAGVMGISGALAADLPRASAPPPPVTIASWSGPYAGLFLGAGGVVNELSSPFIGGSSFNGVGGEGALLGGLIGWNWQVSPSWVLGIQADVAWTNLDTTASAGGGFFTLDAQPSPIWNISLRTGWLANPDTLLYLIGGYSATEYDVSIAFGGGAASFSQDYQGYHIGAGLETRVSPSLTTRLEYRFTRFSSESWGTGGIINVEPSIHSANLALVWNWNDGSSVADGAVPTYIGGSWSGPYVGLLAGAGAVVDELSSPFIGGVSFNGVGGEGALLGGLIGWNWQAAPSWVLGLQADVAWTSLDTEASAGGGFFTLDAQPSPIWNISLRAGWLANPDTLLYLIGGYSATEYDVAIAFGGGAATFSQDYQGYHVGTGLETRLSPSLSGRVEYRYTQFGSESWGTGGIINVEPSIHTGTLALVWNFNSN